MMQAQGSVVVGVFDSQSRAQQAVDALRRVGFTDSQIGFAVRGGTGPQGGSTAGTRPAANTAGAAAGGAVSGGVLGALIGAGAALLIPGIGPAVAGGILATALTGAVVGAAAGGLLGALTNLGVPEAEARYYQSEFEAGRVIVTVQAGARRQEALDILRRYGAYDAQTRPANTAGRWEEVAPTYRTAWQQRYGTTAGRWEEAEPAYRYGAEVAANPYYRGRNWVDVEPEIQRDWERRYPTIAWDQVRTQVQEAAVSDYPPAATTSSTTSTTSYAS